MADEDEIVVTIDPELEADLTGGDGGVAKEPQRSEEPIADLKAQFATLQTTAESATQRAAAAETEAQRAARERDELAARNKDLETEVTDSRKASIDQGLEAAKSEADSAQAEYERAFADGDAKAAALAQRKIARAEATIGRLTEAKSDLVETKPAKRADPAPSQRPSSRDPVEEFIGTRTPATQDWLRKNREWVDFGAKTNLLTAAHYEAVGNGQAPDTPGYFEFVEKKLGIKQDKTQAPKPALTRRPGAPAAPPADAGGNSPSVQQVSLTRAEARAATDGTLVWNYDDPTGKKRFKKGDPIGTQEFARRKMQMGKEGRYDRSMTES